MMLLFLFILYLLFVEPIAEYRAFKKHLLAQSKGDKKSKLSMYQNACFRTCVMLLLIAIYSHFYTIPAEYFGIKAITFKTLYENHLITNILFGLLLLSYFVYMYLFPVILAGINSEIRETVRKKMEGYSSILPVSKREYHWWIVNSLMSFGEEIVYRGIFIFLLPMLIPSLSILLLFVGSVLIDMIRYVSRPNAIFYVLFSGVVFAVCCLVFKSIYIAMMLHILQDLRVLLMPIRFHKNATEEVNYA